jgi:hypothetical protein
MPQSTDLRPPQGCGVDLPGNGARQDTSTRKGWLS